MEDLRAHAVAGVGGAPGAGGVPQTFTTGAAPLNVPLPDRNHHYQIFPHGFDGDPDAGSTLHFAPAFGSVYAPGEGRLGLRGNSRAYLRSTKKNLALDLRGKTLRFTADMSRVPCSANAALYFVAMRGDSYCDIQSSPSCLELDLFEANKGAIQATVHTQEGHGGDGTCNQVSAQHDPCIIRHRGLSEPKSLNAPSGAAYALA